MKCFPCLMYYESADRIAPMGLSVVLRFTDIRLLCVFLSVVPARIVNISTNITVNEGSNVTLMCLAIGRPEPTIIWKHRSKSGKITTVSSVPPPPNPLFC